MTEIALIAWPYDRGLPRTGMGRGADLLLSDDELHERLSALGLAVTVERVASADPAMPELARTFALIRRLAGHVRNAADRGAFALVLAGNCISCLGTTAGIAHRGRLGAVWLDAHADLDTPEDNQSGFLDVMALSILTGGSWRALRRTIPGFAEIAPGDVVLAGARDLEPYQREALERSAVHAVDPGSPRPALDALAERVDTAYLHVDLDVHDASAGRANAYAAPGGPGRETVLRMVRDTLNRLPVAAAALTALDPAIDRDGAMTAAARDIAELIGAHVVRRPHP